MTVEQLLDANRGAMGRRRAAARTGNCIWRRFPSWTGPQSQVRINFMHVLHGQLIISGSIHEDGCSMGEVIVCFSRDAFPIPEGVCSTIFCFSTPRYVQYCTGGRRGESIGGKPDSAGRYDRYLEGRLEGSENDLDKLTRRCTLKDSEKNVLK